LLNELYHKARIVEYGAIIVLDVCNRRGDSMGYKEAKFYEKLAENKVRCHLCPNRCVIADGKVGLCRVRKNVAATLYSLNYGEVTGIALDPVEKKPLFHFHPGKVILSLGTWGCNFHCAFCQNWEISQEKPYYVKRLTPEEVVYLAERYIHQGNVGIAYTYSEPVVWYEFVYETAILAKRVGLRNVLVTNGYVNTEPLRELIPYLDAANVDLKAINNKFYRKVCGGNYEDVLNTIALLYSSGVHVEVTTLLIPDENDDIAELEEEFKFLSSISTDIPLHLSRYHPAYRYTKPPTDFQKMKLTYETAKKYLNYVYLGNVWDPMFESTYCPKCGSAVIIREGYATKIVGLEEGKCKVCNNPIPLKL